VTLFGITSDTINRWLAAGDDDQSPDEFSGLAASPGRAEGIARVVHKVGELAELEDGEILVCPLTAPSWSIVFARIAAAVSDGGGIMSHAAIVSREYELPAVVATGNGTQRVKTGDRIRVDGNSGVVHHPRARGSGFMTGVDEREVPGSTRYVAATADCQPDHLPQVGGKAVGPRQARPSRPARPELICRHGGGLPRAHSQPRARPRRLHARGATGQVEAAYVSLCESRGAGDLAVAVRSSATIEDSTEASCAGQFRTFLGARGVAEVVAEVERCFMSAFEPHVAAYQSDRQISPEAEGVAVIVQELVAARSSGVMFTATPARATAPSS